MEMMKIFFPLTSYFFVDGFPQLFYIGFELFFLCMLLFQTYTLYDYIIVCLKYNILNKMVFMRVYGTLKWFPDIHNIPCLNMLLNSHSPTLHVCYFYHFFLLFLFFVNEPRN